MKRVLIVTSHSYISGIEIHCVNLVRELKQRNYQVEVLAPVEGPIVNQIRSLGIRVHIFNFYRHYWRRVWGLYQIMRKGNFDIVHNHAFTRIALLAAKLAGVKRCIASVHVAGLGKAILSGASRFQLTDYLMDRFVDHYIANSEITRDELINRRIGIRKISVIYLGLDARFFSIPQSIRQPSDMIRIGGLGRLETQKGFCHLIEACRYLNFPFECWIGGTGSLKPLLENQIKSLGLEAKVKLCGETKNSEFYHQIDIFVLSSLFESFGLVIPEAAACRLPIVAADLPVVAEIQQFIPNIITFCTGDARDLAEKLNQLAGQLPYYQSRIQENYAGAKRFTLESMVDQIVYRYEI